MVGSFRYEKILPLPPPLFSVQISSYILNRKLSVEEYPMEVIIFSKILKDRALEEAVRISAEIGYEGIELHDCHFPVDIDPERVKELHRMAEEAEIELVNLATFVGGFSTLSDAKCMEEFNKFEKYLGFAQTLGCPYIRLGPGRPAPETATEEEWLRGASWLRRAADRARPHDISIVLEMHEGSLIATVDSTLKLLEMINRENVVVNYDVGNMEHVPTDYGVDAFRKMEDHVQFIHVRGEKGKGQDGR